MCEPSKVKHSCTDSFIYFAQFEAISMVNVWQIQGGSLYPPWKIQNTNQFVFSSFRVVYLKWLSFMEIGEMTCSSPSWYFRELTLKARKIFFTLRIHLSLAYASRIGLLIFSLLILRTFLSNLLLLSIRPGSSASIPIKKNQSNSSR